MDELKKFRNLLQLQRANVVLTSRSRSKARKVWRDTPPHLLPLSLDAHPLYRASQRYPERVRLPVLYERKSRARIWFNSWTKRRGSPKGNPGKGFAIFIDRMFRLKIIGVIIFLLGALLTSCSGTSKVNAEGYGGKQVAAVYYSTEPGYTCVPPGSDKPVESYKASMQVLENGSAIVTGDECSSKTERAVTSQVQYSLDKQLIVYKNLIFDRSDVPIRASSANYLIPIAWCRPAGAPMDFVIRAGLSPLRFAVTLVQMEGKVAVPQFSLPVDLSGHRPYRTFTSREEDPIFSSTIDFSPRDGNVNPGTLDLLQGGVSSHYNVDCKVLPFWK